MDAREVEVAWAELTARWAEEEAHRAFLARFADLEGLAEAGRRYKATLDSRPGDDVAARWRDEVVRRASALALAQLPRTRPARPLSPGLRRVLLAAVVTASAVAVVWVLRAMARVLPQVLQ
jgi:hypothetical protein